MVLIKWYIFMEHHLCIKDILNFLLLTYNSVSEGTHTYLFYYELVTLLEDTCKIHNVYKIRNLLLFLFIKFLWP